MRKLLFGALIATVLSLLLLFGLLVALVATPAGTQALVALAERHAGAYFSLGAARGTLVDTLVLDDLRVSGDGMQVRIDTAELAWRPWQLLERHLVLNSLVLRGVAVDLAPASDDTPAALPDFPQLPFTLDCKHALAENITVTQDGQTTRLDKLEFVAAYDPHAIRLSELEVVQTPHRVQGRFGILAGAPLTLDASLAIDTVLAGAPAHIELDAVGPLDALALTGRVEGAYGASFALTADVVAAPPGVRGSVDVAAFALGDGSDALSIGASHLVVDGTLDALNVELDSRVARADWGVRLFELSGRFSHAEATRGEFEWHARAAGASAWPELGGNGRFSLRDDHLELTHTSRVPAASTLELAATLGATPSVAGRLSLSAMTIPLAGQAPLALSAADIAFSGPIDVLAVGGNGVFTHPRSGPVSLDFNGELGADRFNLAEFAARLLDGRVDAHGVVFFSDGPRSKLTFSGRGLDLAQVAADFDTRIDLDGEVEVVPGAAAPRVSLRLAHLGGDWRGHHLAARVDATVEGAQVDLRQAHLELGDNVLDVEGRLAETMHGRFDLRASDLAKFAPDLGGSIVADGRVAGTLEAPRIEGQISGSALRYEVVTIRKVAGTVSLDLAADAASTLVLQLDDVRRDGERLGQIELDLDGTTADHRLRAHFSGGPRSGELSARGSWSDAVWTGSLQSLIAELGTPGTWSLAQPVDVRYAEAAVRTGALCMTSADARLCLEVPVWSAAQGRASMQARGLPLAALADFLPTTLTLGGQLSADATLVQKEGVIGATASLATAATRITLDRGADGVETLDVDGFKAALTVDAERLLVNAKADIGDWFALDGEFAYALAAPHALAGEVSVRSDDIGWLAEFVPVIAGSDATLRLMASIGGNAESPTLQLTTNLERGAIVFPDSGARVSRLNLDIRNRDARYLTLQGDIGDGDWQLRLTGGIDSNPAGDWPGVLSVVGENIAVVRLPDAEADVSPALALDFSKTHLDIRGRVTLPRVAVTLTTLPESAVSVSADEVIVGADAPGGNGAAKSPGFFIEHVTGEVDLVLGDAVSIAAAGLNAQLSGGLHWSKLRGDTLGRGEGRVSISKGDYKAYGQNLNIERGHLIFAGPLDNPALDVRAVRPDIDIVAGVAITGSVRVPSFDLFSEPALPDTEILSYIMTGHGFDDATTGEAGLIARAALSLGAERSSMVTSQIQEAFGLDQFSVNAGATAAETSFTAGKRLSPKLSVRSQFNPFDQLWSFFLNYKLTSNWSVEAESGIRQGADVIYSIESNQLVPDALWPGGASSE